MSHFFCSTSSLCIFERQMQQPPGYRPRGKGIFIAGEVEWRSRTSYEEIVDIVISHLQMEQLKKRLDVIFTEEKREPIFYDSKHRNDFYGMLLHRRGRAITHTPKYGAAVFLLSADEELWDKVKGNVLDTGIFFDRIKIGGVTLEQYILFHAAKDVYYNTKHIRLSELADKKLIPDRILKVIVNAFVISRCGIGIIEMED